MFEKIIPFGLVVAFSIWFFSPQLMTNKNDSTHWDDVSPAKAMYYHAKARYACEYAGKFTGAKTVGFVEGYGSLDFCVEELSRTWKVTPSYNPRDDINSKNFRSTDPAALQQRADFINSKGIEIEGWTAKDYEKRRLSMLNREGY